MEFLQYLKSTEYSPPPHVDKLCIKCTFTDLSYFSLGGVRDLRVEPLDTEFYLAFGLRCWSLPARDQCDIFVTFLTYFLHAPLPSFFLSLPQLIFSQCLDDEDLSLPWRRCSFVFCLYVRSSAYML